MGASGIQRMKLRFDADNYIHASKAKRKAPKKHMKIRGSYFENLKLHQLKGVDS